MPDKRVIRIPTPTAGLSVVFVVCTVKVSEPPVMFSPADTLTAVVPESPVGALKYWTYRVSGSEPLAATTCKTLKLTADVLPVKVTPINVEVSVGKALVVVSNLINSYFWFILAPPGLTTAPSLNILLPNLVIWFCKIVWSCVNSLAWTALPELKSILWKFAYLQNHL